MITAKTDLSRNCSKWVYWMEVDGLMDAVVPYPLWMEMDGLMDAGPRPIQTAHHA
jgi:hypothetical protein